MNSSSTKTISEEDGVTVKDARKPRLEVKPTQFGIKVRVHKNDKYALRQFWDLLSDFDIDIVEKNEEFGKSGWVSLARHFLELLSPEFLICKKSNKRLERLLLLKK